MFLRSNIVIDKANTEWDLCWGRLQRLVTLLLLLVVVVVVVVFRASINEWKTRRSFIYFWRKIWMSNYSRVNDHINDKKSSRWAGWQHVKIQYEKTILLTNNMILPKIDQKPPTPPPFLLFRKRQLVIKWKTVFKVLHVKKIYLKFKVLFQVL